MCSRNRTNQGYHPLLIGVAVAVAAAEEQVEKSSAVKTQRFPPEYLGSIVLLLWAGHLPLVRHYLIK